MKVKELIEELKKISGELRVITEGCDCNGFAKSVVVIEYGIEDKYELIAYITRSGKLGKIGENGIYWNFSKKL